MHVGGYLMYYSASQKSLHALSGIPREYSLGTPRTRCTRAQNRVYYVTAQAKERALASCITRECNLASARALRPRSAISLEFARARSPIVKYRVWNHLKQYLTHTYRPKNKQQLLDGIMEFWRKKMTPDQCTRYINHLHRVIPVVIAKNGEAVVDDEIPRRRHNQ